MCRGVLAPIRAGVGPACPVIRNARFPNNLSKPPARPPRRSLHEGPESCLIAAMSEGVNENGLELILPDESDAPRDRWMWGVTLILLVLCVFSPAIWCGYIWDDTRYPLNAAVQNGSDGLFDIWFNPSRPATAHSPAVYTTPQYYPMTYTSFWVGYELWGHDPRGSHAFNIVIQAFAALLLWEVLRRLKVPGAWLAAALFAIHPLQTESVAWVSERKNVLAGLFFFASILTYLRFLRLNSDDSDPPSYGDPGWYWLSLILFICGLLSKSIVCSMPVVVGILIWWKRGKISLKNIALLIPFLICGMAMSAVTSWFEIHIVGATGSDWGFSAVDRIWIAGHVIWFYVMKLIWPVNLTLVYPKWPLGPAEWGYVAATVAVVAILLALQKKIGRGAAAAVLIYLVTLVPAMGFINIFPMRYSYVADHFQYLSGVALIVLAVAIIARILRPLGNSKRIIGLILAIGVLGIYSVSSSSQTHVFTNSETLWRNVIAKNPKAWLAYENLSLVLADQAEQSAADQQDPAQSAKDAKSHAEEAIQMAQHALALRSNLADAHDNWGRALVVLKEPAQALEQFRKAEALDPKLISIKNNIGVALARLGRRQEAEQTYRRAASLSGPPVVRSMIRINLAQMLMEDGAKAGTRAANAKNPAQKKTLTAERASKYLEARQQLESATQITPRDPKAWYQLGLLLIRMGDNHDAFNAMSEATKLDPDMVDAHKELGTLFGLAGQYAEAGQEFLKVVKLEPDNADAYAAMGYMAGKLGNSKAAAEFFNTALKIDPTNARAKQGLALAQAATRPSTTRSTTAPTTEPAGPAAITPAQ